MAREQPAALQPPRGERPTPLDYGRTLALCVAVATLFVLTTPALRHWMVFPVVAAGVLGSVDGMRWLRRRLDLFDPLGLLGVYGFHFFFLAPLLHVRLDVWIPFVERPDDLRSWLGWMALLNVAGLLAYRLALLMVRGSPGRTITWRLDERLFWPALAGALGVSTLIQLWIFAGSGGLAGYIERAVGGGVGFEGLGWLLTISESGPLLALIGWAVWRRQQRRPATGAEVAAALVLFLLAQFLVGGLRGSRANTLFGLFVAAGVVHFLLWRIPRRVLYVGALFAVVFMYFYGFYKSVGTEAVRTLGSRSAQEELEARTGRTLGALILLDLGRADVQALTLQRRGDPDIPYRPRYGATYWEGAAFLVPGFLIGDRPLGKLGAGTELLYDYVPEDADDFTAQNIYGLAGEWMLNFPPILVPIPFFVFGAIAAASTRWARRLATDDLRVVLIPVLPVLLVLGLSSDLDNVLFALLKYGLLPGLVVLIGTTRARRALPASLRTP